MKGPFLTSLLWRYGSAITNADPGDEQPEVSASTVPADIKRAEQQRDRLYADPIGQTTVKRYDGCQHCGAKMDKPHATWCRDFKPVPK